MLRRLLPAPVRRRVRRSLARELGVPSIDDALDAVAGRGFEPRSIVDVGAYHGAFTRECLRRWPRASVACVEPLDQARAQLTRAFGRDPRVRIVPGLLGATEASAVGLHEAETASSILPEHVDQAHPVRMHPMQSLDRLVETTLRHAPDLLKLDVQGYELEVLRGAERTLPALGMILLEVNLLDIHRGVPLLHETVGWLAAREWVAYDVCGLTRRPLDGALWQADLLFVPAMSPLRADKRWQ